MVERELSQLSDTMSTEREEGRPESGGPPESIDKDEQAGGDKAGATAGLLEKMDARVDAIQNNLCSLAGNAVLARAEVLRAKQAAIELNLVEAVLSHLLDATVDNGEGALRLGALGSALLRYHRELGVPGLL